MRRAGGGSAEQTTQRRSRTARTAPHGHLRVFSAIGIGADAAALIEPALDRGAEMDAAIEARDAGFLGRRPEARDSGASAGLRACGSRRRRRNSSPKAWVSTTAAAPDCVLWPLGYSGNGGVMSIGSHFGIDDALDVGDGPQQIVLELAVPAADEGIGGGDAEPREQRRRSCRDRHSPRRAAAARSRSSGRAASATASDRPTRSARWRAVPASARWPSRRPRAPPCRRPRTGPRCSRAAAAGRRPRRSASRRYGCCPSPAAAASAAGAKVLVGTQCAGPAGQRVFVGKAHVLDHRAAVAARPVEDMGGDGPAVAPGCAPARRAQRPRVTWPSSLASQRRHRALAGRARCWRKGP